MLNSIKNNLSTLGKIVVVLAVFFLAACSGQGSGETNRISQDDTSYEQLDDIEITNAVVDELAITRGIDGDLLSVETNEGIVTLSGTTDNLLTKDRATSVASTIKGVRSVVNDIEVQSDRLDVSIAEDVADELLSDPATDSWEIESSVEDGVVNLTGTVESWKEKELVATVTKGVDGVIGINNNIDVDYATNRSDDEILGDVQASIVWNNRLEDGLINVDVNDGVVELSGTVGSLFEKNLAKDIARVAGVTDVNAADLEVKSWMREEMERQDFLADKSVADIERAVNDALAVHPRIDPVNIEVSVNNGIATLTGTVDNLKTARAAAETASNTRGVIATEQNLSVDNQLVVTPDVDSTDEEVRQEVENALERDPFVSAAEIDVVAETGIVTLSGTADNYFEKYQADEVASTVNGVVDIINDINVDYEELTYEPMFYDWDVRDHDYDYEPVVIDDADLKEAIESQLIWSPFVSSVNVNIEVENGVATLSGTVLTETAREEATEEAYEAGAREVVNNLETS
ncbi:MAG: BON domain-containing protein [Balneolaceae bacterium]|nr:BON domain-containing protein [Balneolaceae bacterium]MDR9408128.1 BON domain-containing protein [Balneolaceae bacterium]